jgi:Domain of unknown function (DUF4159)
MVLLAMSAHKAKPAYAFGDQGAFDIRLLVAGGTTGAAYPSAPGHWATELISRTSAPAKLKPAVVRADDATIVESPFLYWSGKLALTPLTGQELTGLRKFFALGGMLVVDDAAPTPEGEPSAFMKTAQEELKRVLPESTPVELAPEHVLFRSFFLIKRPAGRVLGKKALQAIVRSGQAQILFLSNDLGGALARTPTGAPEQAVLPGGEEQREQAVRLAVNIAMYALCSNYKDDQVHAPFLMRRRAVLSEP